MKRLRAALGCLTILPVGPRGEVREADLGGSFLWFPLVGLLIGAVLVGVYTAATRLLPPMVVGACVLLAWIILTGALHLDGVGDVCDGLYGGRTPAERLRIMKDPRVGAMAVVGLSALLLMKFALLASLPQAVMARALLLTPCIGRCAMVFLGTTLPYARAESGTAAAFVRFAHPRALAMAAVLILPLAWTLWGWTGLGLTGAALAANLLLRSVFRRTLGGVTGDALGAAGECTEVLTLLGAAIAMGR